MQDEDVSIDASQESSCSDEDNCFFSLGNRLLAFVPLLEEVFTHLDYRSLQTAALVNSEWEAVAKRILQKRQFPSWITLTSEKNFCLATSKNFTFNNPSLVIIVVCKKIELDQYVCLHSFPVPNRMTCKYLCLFLYYETCYLYVYNPLYLLLAAEKIHFCFYFSIVKFHLFICSLPSWVSY